MEDLQTTSEKKLNKIFNDLGFKITSQSNLKIVDFLDVTLNLNTGKHEPYRKPNDKPLYINKKSNHPPNIIKKIPNTIEKRISTLSSNKDIFQKASVVYNEALKNSGYKTKINYNEQKSQDINENEKKRKRSRNIIWFNPPFSANVRTKIGRKFLNLINKHFPKENKLHKIFNKNSIKVSYSCMKNMNNNKIAEQKYSQQIHK